MGSQDSQRLAVITGASSGIGKEAAKQLVSEGWRVIGHGRDATRCAEAEAEIAAMAANGGSVTMLRADLALLSDTARLAGEITALAPAIDALLCNAGGVRADKVITAEGNEATFAGNHLGHFLLVRELLPALKAAVAAHGQARVINTSSSAHLVSPSFNWDNPQMIDGWASSPAYCLVKLYNILFTRELARRVEADGIVVHAMHPGRVGSRFFTYGDEQMQAYAKAVELDPPEISGGALAWLASAEEPGQSTGRYWFNQTQEEPSDQARDDVGAARLWLESEDLVAKAGF